MRLRSCGRQGGKPVLCVLLPESINYTSAVGVNSSQFLMAILLSVMDTGSTTHDEVYSTKFIRYGHLEWAHGVCGVGDNNR